MGRVVGRWRVANFEVVDVAVDPAYQGRGLGRKVMEYIDNYLSSVACTEGSYVSMIADEPVFYEKLGYKLLISLLWARQSFHPSVCNKNASTMAV